MSNLRSYRDFSLGNKKDWQWPDRMSTRVEEDISFFCAKVTNNGATPIYHCAKIQVSFFEQFSAIVLKLQDNKDDCLFDLVEGIHEQLPCNRHDLDI